MLQNPGGGDSTACLPTLVVCFGFFKARRRCRSHVLLAAPFIVQFLQVFCYFLLGTRLKHILSNFLLFSIMSFPFFFPAFGHPGPVSKLCIQCIQATGRIRFRYPALKVVLKPISWNHPKALFGPKSRPPYGLVGPNHLIPANLGPFSHKHNISHPTIRKAQNAKPKMDTLTTRIENAQVG